MIVCVVNIFPIDLRCVHAIFLAGQSARYVGFTTATHLMVKTA